MTELSQDAPNEAIDFKVDYPAKNKVVVTLELTHAIDLPDESALTGLGLGLKAVYLLLRTAGVSVGEIKRALREVEAINYVTHGDGSKTPNGTPDA